jgi:hypothetical protein
MEHESPFSMIAGRIKLVSFLRAFSLISLQIEPICKPFCIGLTTRLGITGSFGGMRGYKRPLRLQPVNPQKLHTC